MEIFLAKLFGLYFIVIGAVVLIRRRAVMPAVAELVSNRPVRLTIAFIEIAAGLSLALAYPTIDYTVKGIFAVIGYMLIIEGLLYLASPHRATQRFLKRFNKSHWLTSGGVVALAIGAYLVAYGFNLL